MRIDHAFNLGGLAHHRFVERGAAGGVEDHDVVAAKLAGFDGAAGDLWRGLSLDHRQRVDLRVTSKHGELFHRRRTAHVKRSHQHFAALPIGQALRKFGGGGGFAGALQAHHHNGDRRRGIQINRLAVGAERGNELVVHNLHDHLARRHRLHHLHADGLLLHAVGEGARDVECNVGFEQRAANLAKRSIDIGLTESAAACEAVENAAKFFRQVVEHQSANTFAPEGALRCRAMASGLVLDRAAKLEFHVSSENGRYLLRARARVKRTGLQPGACADRPICKYI